MLHMVESKTGAAARLTQCMYISLDQLFMTKDPTMSSASHATRRRSYSVFALVIMCKQHEYSDVTVPSATTIPMGQTQDE